MHCCQITLRLVIIAVALAALITQIVAIVQVLFVLPRSDKPLTEYDAAVAYYNFYKDSATPTERSRAMARLANAEGVTYEGSMTLWKIKLWQTARTEPLKEDLSTGYLFCPDALFRFQVAQAMSVVGCVLCAANLIMSPFLFFFSVVVKYPMAVYSLLAGVATAASFAIMLSLYKYGLCDDAQLKLQERGWGISAGILCFIVSFVLSFVNSILVLITQNKIA